jgi:hypothetical protein
MPLMDAGIAPGPKFAQPSLFSGRVFLWPGFLYDLVIGAGMGVG